MDFSGILKNLPAAEKTRVSNRLSEMQMEATFLAINRSVETCFDMCVNSFRSKTLDASEKECLQKCAGKFIAASERIGSRFEETINGQ